VGELFWKLIESSLEKNNFDFESGFRESRLHVQCGELNRVNLSAFNILSASRDEKICKIF